MTATMLSVLAGLGLLAVTPAQVAGYLKMGFWFVVVVGILVFVHELGHFLVAKRAGVGVLKFSLGFGPKVVGFRRGETEYLISAIPLGGYVKMVGEDPADQAADPAKSFQNKSVVWRSLVVLAGPGMNVILAVFLFSLLTYAGGEAAKEPVVGKVETGSAAEKAGLRPGDRVLAVGGTPVEQWNDIQFRLQEAKGTPVPFQIQRGTDRLEVTVTGVRQTNEVQGFPPKVTQMTPGSAAEQAGIQPGDKVIAYDGTLIAGSEDLQRLVRGRVGQKGRIVVERKGHRLELEVTPRLERDETSSKMVGRIGVTLETDVAQEPVRFTRDEWILGASHLAEPISLHRALGQGFTKTWFSVALTVRVLARLVTGDISPKAIGGPLFIASEAGKQAQQGGLLRVMFLTAVLSVNLAILNLLPVPILDGGHLLFFAIEAVRRGPVSLRKREVAQQVGLALLVALMVFAFYNDIFRLLRPH